VTEEAQQVVLEKYEAADVLVNPAVLLDQFGRIFKPHTYRTTMETNIYGPLLCQIFYTDDDKTQLWASGKCIIGCWPDQIWLIYDSISAEQIHEWPAMMLADSMKGANVLVNAGCPGWVRTGWEAQRHLVLLMKEQKGLYG
jgi:hypothetical protein